jgi:nonribosomal peptide synthetase CepB
MVPAVITPVAQLPLTANGKLDRARLSPAEPVPRSKVAQPRTETERAVCELFASILGVDEVGVDDSFFARGGTSIAAVKLTSAIKRRFDVAMKLKTIIADPTPAAIARVIDQLRRAAAGAVEGRPSPASGESRQ